MNHGQRHDQQSDQTVASPFWGSRYAIGLLVFGAIAAYFLLSEHRAHFIGALPFLFLLACPLMHVLMHGGHGGHGGDHADHEDSGGSSKNPVPPQAGKSGEQT